MIKLRDIGESEPYCEKVARDALTMSTDMLDMFVKKDMLACVGLVSRMKRSSYQDSPWHLVQECCQQSCCPTTTAFQWITRWNVPSPAFLHSCFLAFMHLVRQYHNTTIFKYNSCSILHLVKENKKKRWSTGTETFNWKQPKTQALRASSPVLGSATKQSLTRPRSSMHLVRQDNDITLIRNKQEYSARSYTCFDKTNGRPESKRSALCT